MQVKLSVKEPKNGWTFVTHSDVGLLKSVEWKSDYYDSDDPDEMYWYDQDKCKYHYDAILSATELIRHHMRRLSDAFPATKTLDLR